MPFGFDLTILGAGIRDTAGVRDPVVFRDSRGAAPELSLTPGEQDDLAAFARHGWHFGPDLGAAWRDLPERGPDVEVGVLARRPGRGLVIVQNRVIVAFRRDSEPEGLLARYGKSGKLPFGEDLFTVSLSPPPGDLHEGIEQQIERLKEDGRGSVDWVEPVFTFHLQAPPPNPPASGLRLRQLLLMAKAALTWKYDSPKQWHWPLIDLSEAWEHTRGLGTTVAVIDDGFFTATPEIPSKTVLSLNADGSTRAQPLPGAYHGTFCAALVGAPLNDDLVNGVAPECTLQLVAVSDVMNSDGFAEALKLCAKNGADVITCSLGPKGGTWMNLNTLRTAIDDVHKTGRSGKGTVVVWAVGNDEELIRCTDLESYAPLLCVGPGDENDQRGSSGHGSGLDLIAPGIGVRGLVSLDGATFKMLPQRGGSSFATPIVAGVAALVIAVNSNRTWAQVLDIIQENCDNRPLRPPSADLGWGRVNALKAVKAALP